MRNVVIGYTGCRYSAVSDQYLLGNGYRGFNPIVKRFMGQDNLSPFSLGGVHGYEYTGSDPVNHTDPNGRMFGIPGLFVFLMVAGEVTEEVVATTSVVTLGAEEMVVEATDMAVAGEELVDATLVKTPQQTGLFNRKHGDFEIENNLAKMYTSSGEAQVSMVSSPEDLSIVSDTTKSHKFIFTEDGTLAIGSINKKLDPKVLSHPCLAARAGGGDISSAGYIYRIKDKMFVVNHSGHYTPDFDTLRTVQRHIKEQYGLNVKKVKATSLAHGILKYLPNPF